MGLGALWCGQRFICVHEAQSYLPARITCTSHSHEGVPPDRAPSKPSPDHRREPVPQGANTAASRAAVNCPHRTSCINKWLFTRKIKKFCVAGVKHGPAVLSVRAGCSPSSVSPGRRLGTGDQQQSLFFFQPLGETLEPSRIQGVLVLSLPQRRLDVQRTLGQCPPCSPWHPCKKLQVTRALRGCCSQHGRRDQSQRKSRPDSNSP